MTDYRRWLWLVGDGVSSSVVDPAGTHRACRFASVPIHFQPNVKLNFAFSRKFQYIAKKNIENYDTYDDGEKNKTMYR